MITITLLDEINCQIDGLTSKQFGELQKSLSWHVPGCFVTAAYQLGHWDGKETLLDDSGLTYQYLLPEIIEFLERRGLDENVDIIDNRIEIPEIPEKFIPIDYLKSETGLNFRSQQHDIVNAVVDNQCGMIDAATNTGKTMITVAISKYFEKQFKSIVIVPSAKLLRQTTKDYKDAGLDVVGLEASKIKTNEKRIEAIRKHRHIIVTQKLLPNIVEYEEETGDRVLSDQQFVVMYDEAHIFGDEMFFVFRTALRNCPIRLGLTGTVPKDKLKCVKIFGCLGGGVISVTSVKDLAKSGHSSKIKLSQVVIRHKEIEDLCSPQLVKNGDWDWDKEVLYYLNTERVRRVSEHVSQYTDKNTLILCQPEIAKAISKHLNIPYIDRNTSIDERERLFSTYGTNDGVLVAASYGTSATGVSENRIFRLVLIDVGKDHTRIKQSIGRGLRLDGVLNQCDVVDIYSNTYYGKKHLTERKKIYREDGYTIEKVEEIHI